MDTCSSNVSSEIKGINRERTLLSWGRVALNVETRDGAPTNGSHTTWPGGGRAEEGPDRKREEQGACV